MDGLITLFVILMIVSKLFKKSKPNAKSASRPIPQKEVSFGFEGSRAPRPVAQPPVRTPERSTISPEQLAKRKAELTARFDEKRLRGESLEGYSRPLQASEELAAGRQAGSLNFHSDEGRDICDPSLGHGESSLEEPRIPIFAAHNEQEPLFTASDMVQGFVMSEIFTRPDMNRWKR